MTELLEIALEAALKGSEAILIEKQKSIVVHEKADFTPVTNADLASTRAIEKVLAESRIPLLGEESEMVDWEERKNWQSCWIVDPLDGTKDFMRGGVEYTVNVALQESGLPTIGVIAIPEKRTIYFGEGSQVWKGTFQDAELITSTALSNVPEKESRTLVISRARPTEGLRRYIEKEKEENGNVVVQPSGSSMKFVLLTEGLASEYPRFSPCMEWDVAAGHALLRAQGKDLIRVRDGKTMKYNNGNLVVPHFIAR